MVDRHTTKGIVNNAQQCYANSVIQLIFSSTRLLEIIDGNNSNTLIKGILKSYQKDDPDGLSKVIGEAAGKFIASEIKIPKAPNPNEEIKQSGKIDSQLTKNASQIRQSQTRELDNDLEKALVESMVSDLDKAIAESMDNDLDKAIRLSKEWEIRELKEAIRLSREIDSDLNKALAESIQEIYPGSERGLGRQDEALPFMRYLLNYYCENNIYLQYLARDVTVKTATKKVNYVSELMKDIQIPYEHQFDKSQRHLEDYKAQMEAISFKYTTHPKDYNGIKTTYIIEPSCVYIFTSNVGMDLAPYYLDVKVEFNRGIKYLQYMFRGGIAYDGFGNVRPSGVSGESGGHYYTTKITENGYFKLNDNSFKGMDFASATTTIKGVLHYKPGDENFKFICVLYECIKTYDIKEQLVKQRPKN